MRTLCGRSTISLCICGVLALCFLRVAGDEPRTCGNPSSPAAPQKKPAATGPATEKRFPPLQVSAGFQATLFACDPLIEYPSAIALGPRPGSLFVAIDYMTGLGTEIIRRDEIRLIEDTDGDGYADSAPVYAGGFNSIMGLAYHAGTVYVMHAPYLTALRDTDGDDQADERRDLLSGLGLTPEENPVRLHCANGVTVGHDGWLYLALGDHGCDVKRPEGDRLVLEGGGILRCRPDGGGLHVFSRGLRNIYDVALDEELNVFVRDNENDGGDYKVRVCHSFHGADHGYPYLYSERPDEALAPLADLGLGSSAGVACYLERQFPAEYRGGLFACEWGRAVVHYRLERAAGKAGFAPVRETRFAWGADDDPYGFKPTDLVVDRDGALYVSDWCDGQRPQRGRGRIYRIRHEAGAKQAAENRAAERPRSLDEWIAKLDSESHHERVEAQEAIIAAGADGLQAVQDRIKSQRLGVRGRSHAVWVLAGEGSAASRGKLFESARGDSDPRVRAQAVRALADLVDPVVRRHRLDAVLDDREFAVARRLFKLAEQELAELGDRRVALEALIAIGRLRWRETPHWFTTGSHAAALVGDASLEHAAVQALRRSGKWRDVLMLLHPVTEGPERTIALRALSGQAVPEVADGLIELLQHPDPTRRLEYADALTRIHRKPGPWVYWGYRPPPRPANTVAWEKTDTIEEALDRLLADPDRAVRLAVLAAMRREKVPTRLAALSSWLESEREPARVAAILEALRAHPAEDVRDLMERTVANPKRDLAARRAALALFIAGLDEASEGRLLHLADAVQEDVVSAELIADLLEELGRRPKVSARLELLMELKSPHPEIRRAALAALAERREPDAANAALRLLDDRSAAVRGAAASVAGRLEVRDAADPLLRLARDDDDAVRRASFDALRRLREPRAVPLAVAALADRQTEVAALDVLGELGSSEQAGAVIDVADRDPSPEVVPRAVSFLAKCGQDPALADARRAELARAVAELQGKSGTIVAWRVCGPLALAAAADLSRRIAAGENVAQSASGEEIRWRTLFGTGLDARVRIDPPERPAPAASNVTGVRVWLAVGDVTVSERMPVQVLASSSGTFEIQLDGRRIHQRGESRSFATDSDRCDATLEKGGHRLAVLISAPAEPKEGEGAQFHLRFRRKSASAQHEELVRAALARAGNAGRGRQLFLDADGSQCIKCHRIGEQGERIGPDLSGLGDRFSRIHIIESILEPSRTVTPGYQTLAVALSSGLVVSGIKVAETEETLTLADSQGKQHVLLKSEIEEQAPQSKSTMPDDLAKPLSVEQFVDLIAFLASQKGVREKAEAAADR
ncbi:MAG: PVC-type heme-binding CxxCH protein [Planctomycetales bacterium]